MTESRLILRLTLVIALFLLGASCGPTDQVQNAASTLDNSADEATIRAQIAANIEAYNNGDVVKLTATYAPNGDFIVGSGPRLVGRDAIRDYAEELFSRNYLKAKFSVDAIRFLSSDVAIAEITALFGTSDEIQNRVTYVMVRADDAWLIAAIRFLPVEQ